MEQTVETKYRAAFFRDRPAHNLYDEFSIRHPKMCLSQRAKIFSPFAALKGFEEAIDAKLERYVDKRELTEEEQGQLDATLALLLEQTRNRRLARANRVCATVRYYVPCRDENHEAFGLRGTYETVTGLVRKVDPILRKSLFIADQEIEFADLAEIHIVTLAEEEG